MAKKVKKSNIVVNPPKSISELLRDVDSAMTYTVDSGRTSDTIGINGDDTPRGKQEDIQLLVSALRGGVRSGYLRANSDGSFTPTPFSTPDETSTETTVANLQVLTIGKKGRYKRQELFLSAIQRYAAEHSTYEVRPGEAASDEAIAAAAGAATQYRIQESKVENELRNTAERSEEEVKKQREKLKTSLQKTSYSVAIGLLTVVDAKIAALQNQLTERNGRDQSSLTEEERAKLQEEIISLSQQIDQQQQSQTKIKEQQTNVEQHREKLAQAQGDLAKAEAELKEAKDKNKNAKTRKKIEGRIGTLRRQVESLQRDVLQAEATAATNIMADISTIVPAVSQMIEQSETSFTQPSVKKAKDNIVAIKPEITSVIETLDAEIERLKQEIELKVKRSKELREKGTNRTKEEEQEFVQLTSEMKSIEKQQSHLTDLKKIFQSVTDLSSTITVALSAKQQLQAGKMEQRRLLTQAQLLWAQASPNPVSAYDELRTMLLASGMTEEQVNAINWEQIKSEKDIRIKPTQLDETRIGLSLDDIRTEVSKASDEIFESELRQIMAETSTTFSAVDNVRAYSEALRKQLRDGTIDSARDAAATSLAETALAGYAGNIAGVASLDVALYQMRLAGVLELLGPHAGTLAAIASGDKVEDSDYNDTYTAYKKAVEACPEDLRGLLQEMSGVTIAKTEDESFELQPAEVKSEFEGVLSAVCEADNKISKGTKRKAKLGQLDSDIQAYNIESVRTKIEEAAERRRARTQIIETQMEQKQESIATELTRLVESGELESAIALAGTRIATVGLTPSSDYAANPEEFRNRLVEQRGLLTRAMDIDGRVADENAAKIYQSTVQQTLLEMRTEIYESFNMFYQQRQSALGGSEIVKRSKDDFIASYVSEIDQVARNTTEIAKLEKQIKAIEERYEAEGRTPNLTEQLTIDSANAQMQLLRQQQIDILDVVDIKEETLQIRHMLTAIKIEKFSKVTKREAEILRELDQHMDTESAAYGRNEKLDLEKHFAIAREKERRAAAISVYKQTLKDRNPSLSDDAIEKMVQEFEVKHKKAKSEKIIEAIAEDMSAGAMHLTKEQTEMLRKNIETAVDSNLSTVDSPQGTLEERKEKYGFVVLWSVGEKGLVQEEFPLDAAGRKACEERRKEIQASYSSATTAEGRGQRKNKLREELRKPYNEERIKILQDQSLALSQSITTLRSIQTQLDVKLKAARTKAERNRYKKLIKEYNALIADCESRQAEAVAVAGKRGALPIYGTRLVNGEPVEDRSIVMGYAQTIADNLEPVKDKHGKVVGYTQKPNEAESVATEPELTAEELDAQVAEAFAQPEAAATETEAIVETPTTEVTAENTATESVATDEAEQTDVKVDEATQEQAAAESEAVTADQSETPEPPTATTEPVVETPDHTVEIARSELEESRAALAAIPENERESRKKEVEALQEKIREAGQHIARSQTSSRPQQPQAEPTVEPTATRSAAPQPAAPQQPQAAQPAAQQPRSASQPAPTVAQPATETGATAPEKTPEELAAEAVAKAQAAARARAAATGAQAAQPAQPQAAQQPRSAAPQQPQAAQPEPTAEPTATRSAAQPATGTGATATQPAAQQSQDVPKTEREKLFEFTYNNLVKSEAMKNNQGSTLPVELAIDYYQESLNQGKIPPEQTATVSGYIEFLKKIKTAQETNSEITPDANELARTIITQAGLGYASLAASGTESLIKDGVPQEEYASEMRKLMESHTETSDPDNFVEQVETQYAEVCQAMENREREIYEAVHNNPELQATINLINKMKFSKADKVAAKLAANIWGKEIAALDVKIAENQLKESLRTIAEKQKEIEIRRAREQQQGTTQQAAQQPRPAAQQAPAAVQPQPQNQGAPVTPAIEVDQNMIQPTIPTRPNQTHGTTPQTGNGPSNGQRPQGAQTTPGGRRK